MPISNTHQIAKNTLMLYFRQILIMLVSLYTIRVVLNTLGAEDYGIYNVVSGVVLMFGFLSNSMAGVSQRYFAFEIGRSDYEQLRRVFSLNFCIYILITVVVLLLTETVGMWFVNNKLSIPPGRRSAVLWVYQFAVISFIFTILTTPYMAVIIAHEDMNIYAYVSILEAVLKLGIVFILEVVESDKLKVYGILMCGVVFINTAIYRTICVAKYKECKLIFYWDKKLFKEIFAYNGWNLFGHISGMLRNQGTTVLLNQFFNPLVVAAQSIAASVNAAVSSFSSNFLNALHPQIIKNYSAGQKENMQRLAFRGAKASYFLMYLFSLPFFLEMPIILSLWLKQPPQYAVVFTRLILINVLVNSISYPIVTMAMATGRIKGYMLTLGLIQVLGFIAALIILLVGFSPWTVFVLSIGIDVVMFNVRLFLTKKLVGFSIKEFFKKTVYPVCIVSLLSPVVPVIIMLVINQSILRLFAVGFFAVISLGVCVFTLGLDVEERRRVRYSLASRLGRSTK
jgi:O-antigen/teichoic acid export membrane protein